MKTLKDLYKEACGWLPKHIENKLKRADMTYAAKYYNIDRKAIDSKFLKNEIKKHYHINSTSIDLPCHVCIGIDDGTLVIFHLKKNTKILKALEELGFSE